VEILNVFLLDRTRILRIFKIRRVLVVACQLLPIFLCSEFLYAQQTDTAKLKKLEAEVNAASQAGNYVQAASLLKQVIDMGIRDSSLYYGIAVVYGLGGDTDEGRIYLDTAIARGWILNSDGGLVEGLLKIGPELSIDSSLQQAGQEAKAMKPTRGSNPEVHFMFEEDQNDRFKAFRLDHARQVKLLMQVSRIDADHRARVRALVNANKLKTKDDFYEAGSIMSHGIDSADFRMAVNLAETAVKRGDASARDLLAHSEDKYLLSIGKPQKYGTQFFRDTKTGEFKNYPINSETTDEEREKMGLPSLEALKKQVVAGYGLN
jgi:hypothetical protein